MAQRRGQIWVNVNVNGGKDFLHCGGGEGGESLPLRRELKKIERLFKKKLSTPRENSCPSACNRTEATKLSEGFQVAVVPNSFSRSEMALFGSHFGKRRRENDENAKHGLGRARGHGEIKVKKLIGTF